MADIKLVDVSFRDGNQSLWGATGISTPQMLQIAPVMDRVGFHALDFTSSTHMAMAVRTYQEDPWERIRLMREAMPNTPLQFIGTGIRFISWEQAHPEFMQLVYDRLVANGISRFIVLDPMHDVEACLETARQIRQAGGEEITAALIYTISDIHDDAFYAKFAASMAASPDIDRVYLKDPSGLLTRERTQTIIPAIKQAIGDTSLELHSHCTIGLGSLSCLAAADLGVEVLHVACGPLANGGSLPDAVRMAANLRELVHQVTVDDAALAKVAAYLHDMAKAEGKPAGIPQDYDAAFLRHQMAGGTLTTTRRQLAEIGQEHRFDEVMAEVIQVRAEMGYPIMVTPFPQMVCAQALFNVMGKERYGNVPDQVIRYVLGSFGRPTAAVDANILDRIMAFPRTKEIREEAAPRPPAELRKHFAKNISDDEFLLRAVMPADQVDAMVAAGPAKRHYNPEIKPVLELLRELKQRPAFSELVIEKENFKLELLNYDETGAVQTDPG